MVLQLVGRLSVGKNGQTVCGDGQTGHLERELSIGEGVKKVARPRRTTKTGRAGGRVILFV
jgi:hypothetical protein